MALPCRTPAAPRQRTKATSHLKCQCLNDLEVDHEATFAEFRQIFDVHDAASLYLPLHDEFTPDLPAWTEGTALEFTPPLDGAATPPPHAARQPSRQDMLQMIQDAANSVMIQAATGSVPAPTMAPA